MGKLCRTHSQPTWLNTKGVYGVSTELLLGSPAAPIDGEAISKSQESGRFGYAEFERVHSCSFLDNLDRESLTL